MATQQTSPELKLEIIYLPVDQPKPNPRNPRRHPKRQMVALVATIRKHGFHAPIILDENGSMLAGHARLQAAKAVGLTHVPCLRLTHLSPAQKIAVALSDNKTSDLGYDDPDAVLAQLQEIISQGFTIEDTAFSTAEFDFMCEAPKVVASPNKIDTFEEPEPDEPAVTRSDDLWLLGEHRLTCGDARQEAA